MYLKKIFGKVVTLGGWCAALYVSVWIMFLKPIIETCWAYGAGTLTGSMIFIVILEVIFAMPVASIIVCLGTELGEYIDYWVS